MQQNPGRTKLRTLALLTGMGLMIPCYLFTVGNIWFSPWLLYARNRVAIVVLTVLCALGLLAAFGAIGRHEAFLARHRRRILAFAALFYLLVQILMGLALRFTPITDTEQCFTAAQLLADTGDFGNVERPFVYFTRCPHNLSLVYLLSALFRFCGAFGLNDRFMQAVVLCSLFFTAGLIASAQLAGRLGGVRAQMRLLVLFALCLPLLYCTTEIYTDAFSVAFPSLMIDAFLRARESRGWARKLAFCAAFAVFAFVGAQMRVTALIAAIACLIAALFDGQIRLFFAMLLTLALVLVPGTAAVQRENARHLGAQNIEERELPILHYLAMGLPVQVDEGYGQYGYGGWYLFTTSFEDTQERDAALLEEVIDRIYYLRYPNRLLNMLSRKNLSTFGDGTFSLNEIIQADEPQADNPVKAVIFAQGPLYPAYYHLCTGMFMAQMLLACLACAQAIRRRDTTGAPLFLTLLGAFLFLSLWETRGRYFFQFEMILLCAAALVQPLKKRTKQGKPSPAQETDTADTH